MDLISIVVPIYNVEEYLEQCIQSIVRQTYPNLEIILVDDGSPDRCPEICDEWSKRDKRIKVIHKANGGLSDARNAGIDLATGNYIGFVDSDDWIESTMYSNLLKTCRKYHSDIACCGRIITDGKGKDRERFTAKENCFSAEEALRQSFLGEQVDVSVWDKLYKTSLFDGIRFPIGENNEDTAIYYRLIHKSGNVGHTGTSEYHYRCRKGSITQSNYRVKDRVNVFKHLDELESFVRERYPSTLTCFFQYKAVNIFYLLLKYLKSEMYPDEEYPFLLTNYQRVRKYLYINPSIGLKDKLISVMIMVNLYKPYIALKNKFTSRNEKVR